MPTEPTNCCSISWPKVSLLSCQMTSITAQNDGQVRFLQHCTHSSLKSRVGQPLIPPLVNINDHVMLAVTTQGQNKAVNKTKCCPTRACILDTRLTPNMHIEDCKKKM